MQCTCPGVAPCLARHLEPFLTQNLAAQLLIFSSETQKDTNLFKLKPTNAPQRLSSDMCSPSFLIHSTGLSKTGKKASIRQPIHSISEVTSARIDTPSASYILKPPKTFSSCHYAAGARSFCRKDRRTRASEASSRLPLFGMCSGSPEYIPAEKV